MSREHIRTAAIFCLLVCMGVLLRVAFQHLPNVAPVAALALFAGYYFRSTMLAIAAPVCVMLISDRLIGGYEGAVMIAVYASLSLPVALQWILRRNVDVKSNQPTAALRSGSTLFACSLISSVLFFVVTNLAVWGFSELYSSNLAGLNACFTQAVPFFRYTLAGDLAYTTALFGGYALCLRLLKQPLLVSEPLSIGL